MNAHDESRLRFVVCRRHIPALVGEEHAVTRILRSLRHRAVQTEDGHLDLDEVDVVVLLENCGWFPTIVDRLAAGRGNSRTPLVVVWHWEPLPLPAAAGLPPPSLSLRERAKILFRDIRATDPYTNLSHVERMSRQGWYDLLIVSSQAWQESLLERDISCHWVPYGYESGDGAPTGAPRDIAALFLGAVNVPRRRRIIRQLRRGGVDVVAKGSWFDKACWGHERTGLFDVSAQHLPQRRMQQMCRGVIASRRIADRGRDVRRDDVPRLQRPVHNTDAVKSRPVRHAQHGRDLGLRARGRDRSHVGDLTARFEVERRLREGGVAFLAGLECAHLLMIGVEQGNDRGIHRRRVVSPEHLFADRS